MKTFSTKWWTLDLPDGARIAVCRDYTAISLPDEPNIEVRLNVLRGEHADTTTQDLESYASSFCDGMKDRISFERNGWTGFIFTFVDPKSAQVSLRGYFGKQRYLAILALDKPTNEHASHRNIMEKIINLLKVKPAVDTGS